MGPSKMDPSQLDTWWKTIIDKEEKTYGVKDKPDPSSPKPLPDASKPKAAESHLSGAGALVKQTKTAPEDRLTTTNATYGAKSSLTPKADGDAASETGAARSTASHARSHISQGSKAGSKAGSSAEIMNRLARLEKDLIAERIRREAAEHEMKELLIRSHAPDGSTAC